MTGRRARNRFVCRVPAAAPIVVLVLATFCNVWLGAVWAQAPKRNPHAAPSSPRPAGTSEGLPAANVDAGAFSSPPRLPVALPGVLHYEAHWKLLPVGTAALWWSDAGGSREIHFTADSNRLVSLFYPVHDRMNSIYDAASLCTQSVDNDTVEGRRQRRTRIEYEPAQHRMILDETDPGDHGPSAKHVVKPIPGCVEDLFTALDYARGQALRVGDSYDFPVNEGGKTTTVHLRVDLKETITTPAGTFTTVRVVPSVIGKSPLPHPGRMWVWFSDDARHLPVQIKATVSWGTILAQLTK